MHRLNRHLLVIAGATIRKRLERGALYVDTLGIAGVAAANELIDEPPVGGEIVEVAAPPHQQRILDRQLEMSVRPLDRAVLMGDAYIVAGRRHSIVGTQLVIAAGQVILGLTLEIAERGG